MRTQSYYSLKQNELQQTTIRKVTPYPCKAKREEDQPDCQNLTASRSWKACGQCRLPRGTSSPTLDTWGCSKMLCDIENNDVTPIDHKQHTLSSASTTGLRSVTQARTQAPVVETSTSQSSFFDFFRMVNLRKLPKTKKDGYCLRCRGRQRLCLPGQCFSFIVVSRCKINASM